MDNDNKVSKYDRQRGALTGVAVFAKPTTIKHVEDVTGFATSWIVEVGRHDELGHFAFVEMLDGDTVTKLALPPKVIAAIIRQQASILKKLQKRSGKEQAKLRKAAGLPPAFMKKSA